MIDIGLFYEDVLKLSDQELIRILTSNSKVYFIEKGDILENIGDLNSNLYFLHQGLLRGYFLDVKGHEITDCFGFIPGTPVVSCLDLDMPTPICIEALENSSIISIPFNILLPLLESNMDLVNLYNRLLRNSLKMHWENKIILSQSTASERYLWFLERFPGLIDCVSHKYIASYLGMTPVSLSRIRRAIKENKV